MNFRQIVSNAESLEQAADVTNQLQLPEDKPLETEEAIDAYSETEVTEAETDLVNTSNGIDAISTGINDAEKAINTINDITAVVKENDDAVISDSEEKLVIATHEHILSSLGLPNVQSTLESVPLTDRREHLVSTLESSSDNIFKKILKGIVKILNNVIDFISNLIRNSWILKKYLNYVREKVKKLNGDPTNEFMTESAKAITADGKAGMESIKKMNATALGLMKMSDTAAALFKSTNFKYSLEKNEGLTLKGIMIDDGLVPRNISSFSTKSSSTYGYLTNGRAFTAEGTFLVKKSYSDVITSSEIAEEAKVATISEMNEILDMAEVLIKRITEYDRNRSVFKNTISSITQYITQSGLSTIGIVNSSARNATYDIGSIRGYRDVLTSVSSKFPLETFRTAKAFISYVSNSCKYYA